MHKADKERVVEELTERLRSSEALLVADYRGLTNSELAGLRVKLTTHGAKLSVVKNTLTRRAAEAAGRRRAARAARGADRDRVRRRADGDPVAVAKALSDAARDTKILALRGGVLSGNAITADEIERLAKLPPLDVLQAQLVGVIVAPLTQLARAAERAAAEPRRPHRRTDRAARGGAATHRRRTCAARRAGRRAGRGRGRGGTRRRGGADEAEEPSRDARRGSDRRRGAGGRGAAAEATEDETDTTD